MNLAWTHSWPIYMFLTMMGLALGSFLNVVIYRLPRGESLIKPSSHCPSCGTPIPFYLNIPIISYLILGGRCHRCRAHISIRYPVIELIAAAAVVGLYIWLGPSWEYLGYTLLILSLIAVFFIDLEHYIIPDQITYPGIVVGILFSLVNPKLGIVPSLLGLLAGGGSLLLLSYLGDWLFKKESLGGGDIKLAAMLGAFLGWQKILFIFIAASVIGLLGAIVALGFSHRLRQTHRLPFGPFLAVAAVAAILIGDYLIGLYVAHLRAF